MPTKYLTEPPPSLVGKYPRAGDPEHEKLVKSAKRKPGKWIAARSFEAAPSASRWAHRVRSGRFIAFRDGTFEATVRDKTVYIRFIDEGN